ncbi:MAG: hypothetical protein EOP61_13950, partial [Sphingomonadales bacterium]
MAQMVGAELGLEAIAPIGHRAIRNWHIVRRAIQNAAKPLRKWSKAAISTALENGPSGKSRRCEERNYMTGISVKDLGPEYKFGSIVHGVTWDTLKDEAVRQQLRDIFEDRGLIVFEGVEASGKMQAELSKVFGPLKDHPTSTTPRVTEDYVPGLIDMHSQPRDISNGDLRGLVKKNGKILTRYSPWHFDHCYNDELNLAGVLRVVKNSPEGGRTGFADGVTIYKDFDPELRAKIEGINVIYTLDTRLTTMRFGRDFETFGDVPGMQKVVEEAKVFPRAMHPAVFEHPTNGEKVLHIGPWMSVGLEHHEDAEGEALFEAACQELNKRAYA